MPDLTAEDVMAWGWALWAASGHAKTCKGWTFESRDHQLVCCCGDVLFVAEAVT